MGEDALVSAAPELLEGVAARALYPLTELADSIFESHTVGGELETMDSDVRKEYDELICLISDITRAIEKAKGRAA